MEVNNCGCCICYNVILIKFVVYLFDMGQLKNLVIHCSATPEGRNVTKEDIIKWHTAPKPEGRGWSRVGYSDMIALNGNLINLLPRNPHDFFQVVFCYSGSGIPSGNQFFNRDIRNIPYYSKNLLCKFFCLYRVHCRSLMNPMSDFNV